MVSRNPKMPFALLKLSRRLQHLIFAMSESANRLNGYASLEDGQQIVVRDNPQMRLSTGATSASELSAATPCDAMLIDSVIISFQNAMQYFPRHGEVTEAERLFCHNLGIYKQRQQNVARSLSWIRS
jgi:hypothetical protein